MAIARMEVACAVQGTKLSAAGISAIAHALPFDDPKKSKRMAVG
jgi:aminomethyltransferase